MVDARQIQSAEVSSLVAFVIRAMKVSFRVVWRSAPVRSDSDRHVSRQFLQISSDEVFCCHEAAEHARTLRQQGFGSADEVFSHVRERDGDCMLQNNRS